MISEFKQLGKEKVIVTNTDTFVTKASLLRDNNYCGMSGFSAKRDLLEGMLFDEAFNNGQDWDMYVRLFQKGVNFANIPEPIFLYRFQNEDGIRTKVRKMKPSEIDKRLGSAIKHKNFLGEFWFKKEFLNKCCFLSNIKKFLWIAIAIKMAGLKATLYFFLNAIRRKIANKPISI